MPVGLPSSSAPVRARPWWRRLALLLAALPAVAIAQQQPNSGVSIGPSQNVQQPAPTPAPAEEHLFGDWGGGVRTSLGNLGIDLVLDFYSEFEGNISGGTKQGATFANQVGLEADIDWEKLAGIAGLSTHAVVVNRSGSSDSLLFGDHVNAVQEIYGGGGDVGVHFVYAYAEESLADGRIDIAAGRMPVLNDFAASTLYCTFVNVSICGNPAALGSGDVGLTVFPDATWGGRARVRPSETTYLQAGVYEVSSAEFQYPYFRSAWSFNTSRDTGVELPVELGYEPKIGAAKLPGHYKLGLGFDSSTYNDLYLASSGVPAILAGQPDATHRGRFTYWALADQMLLRNGDGDDAGLIVLGAYVHGDPNATAYAEQYTAGLLDTGFWPARPQDSINALFTYQQISKPLQRQESLDEEFGLALPSGATAVQKSEKIFELNYNIHVTNGVTFQPDFQYVIRPNAQGNIKNATVLGFRTHVTF